MSDSTDQNLYVREFSPVGPCLTRGPLLRTTPRFYFYRDYKGQERRISLANAHAEPCQSCRDHARTMYPDGYTD